jgi:predicted ArsR family transcriptional regulator
MSDTLYRYVPRLGEVQVLAKLLEANDNWTHAYSLKKQGISGSTALRHFGNLYSMGLLERESQVRTNNGQCATCYRLTARGRQHAIKRIEEFELNHETEILDKEAVYD